jgi:hypothetical protein
MEYSLTVGWPAEATSKRSSRPAPAVNADPSREAAIVDRVAKDVKRADGELGRFVQMNLGSQSYPARDGEAGTSAAEFGRT